MIITILLLLLSPPSTPALVLDIECRLVSSDGRKADVTLLLFDDDLIKLRRYNIHPFTSKDLKYDFEILNISLNDSAKLRCNQIGSIYSYQCSDGVEFHIWSSETEKFSPSSFHTISKDNRRLFSHLCNLLGSPKYKTRQRASESLIAHGRPTIGTILQTMQSTKDQEVINRCINCLLEIRRGP